MLVIIINVNNHVHKKTSPRTGSRVYFSKKSQFSDERLMRTLNVTFIFFMVTY